MLKLLPVLAYLVIAHALPIEQNEESAIPIAAAEIENSNLKPASGKPTDQWLIDPVSLPTPTESESSVPSFEPEKHEESVVEEPNEGKDPAKNEISVPSPESGNREEIIVSEPIKSNPIVPEEPVVSEQPIVSEPIVSEPIVSEQPIVSEPMVSEQHTDLKPIVSEQPKVSEPMVSEQPIVPQPIVSEPIVSVPIVSEPIVSEPIVSAPIVSEQIVKTPPAIVEVSLPNPESEKHKNPETIEPINNIFKQESTEPSVASANQEEDEKELEAALDEFFKFLNLTESEEMEDEVIGSILLGMFEGLDELINALELMAQSTDQREDSAILLKRNINNPLMTNIFLSKPATPPEAPISVNHQKLNKENEANEDDSPAAACKTEGGLPGLCVPYYLCATTSQPDENVISVELDYETCPTVLEICCSSENLQLGTGAGLRKY